VIVEENEASRTPLALYHSSAEDLFAGFYCRGVCGHTAQHKHYFAARKNLHNCFLSARDSFPPITPEHKMNLGIRLVRHMKSYKGV